MIENRAGWGQRRPAVVVTGAATGIGRATARELGARGFQVFGSVRRPADAAQLQADLGGAVTPLYCDVTDTDAVAAAARQCATGSPAKRWRGSSTMPGSP
jgi:NAD(P)-dependent dehydrogenase (short-subunit alcohol dehydrogenase family)